ncbi:hypothetical protein VUR80DRAFT_2591 [Thermomyces stellatus]
MLARRVVQAARPLMRTSRPMLVLSQTRLQLGSRQTRLSSSSSSSPTSSFYKTFSRPIAKTLLIAMLTYQIVYLLWVKLEVDETKRLRNAEIGELESKVKELQERKRS